MDQPTVSLFAPPRAGQNCETGGGKPSLTQMPQIQHVCLTAGSNWMAPLKRPLPTGIGAEALPTGGRVGEGGVKNCNHQLQNPLSPISFLN